MKKFSLVVLTLSGIFYSGCIFAHSYSGETSQWFLTPFQKVPFTDYSVQMSFDVKIKWKTWTLFNEPVIDSVAKWRFDDVTIRDSQHETRYISCKDATGDGVCLPDKVISAIGIDAIFVQDFVLRNYSLINSRYFLLPLDPGVFSKPAIGSSTPIDSAKNSFNTPSSPEWKKFILRRTPTDWFSDNHKDFFNENEAKKVFKDKSSFKLPENLHLVYFSAGYFPLIQFHNSIIEKKELTKIKKEAINNKNKIINRIRKTDDDDIFSDFENEMVTKKIDDNSNKKKEIINTHSNKIIENLKKLKNSDMHNLSLAKIRVKNHRMPVDPNENLLAFYDKDKHKYGFKNSKGQIIIAPKYDKAHNFSDGLGAVYDHAWGFINNKAQYVIKPHFDWVNEDFKNGKAKVRIGDTRCYDKGYYIVINKKGSYLSTKEYEMGSCDFIHLTREP